MTAASKVSRGSAELVASIRADIEGGAYRPGQFLPSAREICGNFNVSAETVRRGLKILEGEGLLVAEPRQGFRVVLPQGPELQKNPLAYVTDFRPEMTEAQPANWAIRNSLQDISGQRGWTTLGVYAGGEIARVAGQLRRARVWGAIIDTLNRDLVRAVTDLELPAVMVNSWVENGDVDTVIQDNYQGGFLAAAHLLESGARRIGWVGPQEEFCHSRERFAGAAACLSMAGKTIESRDTLKLAGKSSAQKLKKILSRPDRPEAMLVFWKGAAALTAQVARELGLQLGRDLLLIGWCVEELFESEHLAVFAGSVLPPAIVWKAAEMTRSALQRLEAGIQRQTGQRTCIPVRLRLPQEKPETV
jgi:DNA-binding LacI/PurR family transcriptional regulator